MVDSLTAGEPRTLGALLEARSRTMPDATFVIFDDLVGGVTVRTYRQLDSEVNRTAHLLGRLGVGRGDTITLLLANSLEFLSLWFGAAKLGAVIVPINTGSSASELEYLVAHSESRLIFTEAARFDLVRQARGRCPRVEEVLVCGNGAPLPDVDFGRRVAECPETPPEAPAPLPSDEAAILYTSGTTARPKGVLVTHANYICAGETVARAVGLTPDDRHLVVLPLFHGNAQYYSTMSALVTGASVALMARFSASRYFDQAIAHRCTVSSLFAAPIRMLLAQPRRPEHARNELRAVIFAQSVTPAQLAEWEERFGAPLVQLWGMTETMGPPIINPLDGERRNMSMGLPAPGYSARLVDEDGRSVARGDIGQIVVRGEPGLSLMKGYYKNPEATAETLRDGWLWSGDNARQDDDGYYHFVDRAKDMIKRSGENVAASEVEAVIREHPGVFDCAVIGVPDAMRDEAIVAVVVPRAAEGDVPAVALTEDEVLVWCRERLASFRVPQFVRFRAELPRTAVGKIRKHVLRAEFHSRTGAGGSGSGPGPSAARLGTAE
ncbi:MAG: AMP-binding protein [Acidobacteria bacterium]|nr:AMP-binding protein [Acidobacteriota bacterium]